MFAAALATVAVWFGMEQRRTAEVTHDLRDTGALGALAVALARKRGKTQSLLAAVEDAGTGSTDVDELRAYVVPLRIEGWRPFEVPGLGAKVDRGKCTRIRPLHRELRMSSGLMLIAFDGIPPCI